MYGGKQKSIEYNSKDSKWLQLILKKVYDKQKNLVKPINMFNKSEKVEKQESFEELKKNIHENSINF